MEGERGVEESRAHFRHPPKLPTASADVDVDNDDNDDDDGGDGDDGDDGDDDGDGDDGSGDDDDVLNLDFIFHPSSSLTGEGGAKTMMKNIRMKIYFCCCAFVQLK